MSPIGTLVGLKQTIVRVDHLPVPEAEAVVHAAVFEVIREYGLEEEYEGNFDDNPLPAGFTAALTDRILDELIQEDLLRHDVVEST